MVPSVSIFHTICLSVHGLLRNSSISFFSTVFFLMPRHLNSDMIVCGKHVYCLHDCVETSLSDCSTMYWKQQIIYPRYLKIDNSAVRQYFQTKFCAYFTEYFRIKHTKFTQDAFRFHISVVYCVGFTFFRTQCMYKIMVSQSSSTSFDHFRFTILT